MKKALHHVLLGFVATAFLFGCSKSGDAPALTREQKVAGYLTGVGNRYWHLKEVYVNGSQQVLTDYQMKYTKTYTIDPTNTDPTRPRGTFVNSDGYSGEWKLTGGGDYIYETITNNPVGPVAVSYFINDISESLLDIEYTANYKTTREVYYAY